MNIRQHNICTDIYSWFKGPYKVLENRWRIKYDVNKLFEKLSKASMRSSKKANMIKYMKILFEKNNYSKIKNYKYDRQRQKWRYKRLLGKRSYIDRLTNDLAYGSDLSTESIESIESTELTELTESTESTELIESSKKKTIKEI